MIRDWIAERNRRIFDLKITPVFEHEIIEATGLAIEGGEQLVIASLNVHGLYVAVTDDRFRELHDLPQTLVHTDGIGVVWSAWLHRIPLVIKHRTGVHDWLPKLAAEAAQRGWRVYCLGSDPEVNRLAVDRLRTANESLAIAGRDGFFDPSSGGEESARVVAAIDDFDADIVVVGMGMGRQETWILEHLDVLGARTIITCGACLEYASGEMPMSPRWFGPVGLEMVWRVVTRPRRYAYRYLVEPWDLLWRVVRQGRFFGPLIDAWRPRRGRDRR